MGKQVEVTKVTAENGIRFFSETSKHELFVLLNLSWSDSKQLFESTKGLFEEQVANGAFSITYKLWGIELEGFLNGNYAQLYIPQNKELGYEFITYVFNNQKYLNSLQSLGEVKEFLRKKFPTIEKENVENAERVKEEVRESKITSVPTVIVDGVPSFDDGLVTFEQLYSLFNDNDNCTL